MSLAWDDVQAITKGHIGRTIRTPCPFCSNSRRAVNRRLKVFAVQLKEPGFAVFNCVHCGARGSIHPERSAHVVDLVERQRLRAQADRRDREDKERRTAAALELWADRRAFRGSRAEVYLRDTRDIGAWLDTFDLDDVLGFHPSCPFGQERHPCMLALVRNIETNKPQAVHRTALTTEPQRIGRLSLGPTSGGAVKLSADHEVTHGLMIGEGIETVLKASRLFKFKPCWSVISRSGIARFPILAGIECVTICVDNDESGDGQRDAAHLVERLVAAGVEAITTQTNLKKDFNEIKIRENR
jgi:putative DNA primase/helicase